MHSVVSPKELKELIDEDANLRRGHGILHKPLMLRLLIGGLLLFWEAQLIVAQSPEARPSAYS